MSNDTIAAIVAKDTDSESTDSDKETPSPRPNLVMALAVRLHNLERMELIRQRRIAQRTSSTKSEVRAKTRRAISKILSEKVAELSLELDGMSRVYLGGNLQDQADLIGRVWAKIVREFVRNNSQWREDFLTNNTQRRIYLSRMFQTCRRDVYRANKRNIGELAMWEKLVYADETATVVRMQSSGAGPADLAGNRPATYVDGTGKLDTGIRSNKRVNDALYSRMPNPSDIDEYGYNRFDAFPRYARRLVEYFGVNEVAKAAQIVHLFEAILSSYQSAKANEFADKESVRAFNMGNVRWEKRRNSEKGVHANVRDLLHIPADVSLDDIRNEARRWAQIALYREPTYRPQLGDKRRIQTAELILNARTNYLMDNFMWKPEQRSDKVHDSRPVSETLHTYAWRKVDPKEENSPWIFLPDWMNTRPQDAANNPAIEDLASFDIHLEYTSPYTGNKVEETRTMTEEITLIHERELRRMSGLTQGYFTLSDEAVSDLIHRSKDVSYRQGSPINEPYYHHSSTPMDGRLAERLAVKLLGLRLRIYRENGSGYGRVSEHIAEMESTGLWKAARSRKEN